MLWSHQWSAFWKNSWWVAQVLGGHIVKWIVKEPRGVLSQSTHWILCRVNCESDQGFLSQSAWWVLFGVNCERTQGFLSQSTHWALCWALFKSIHPVPSEYWVGKLFQNPELTHHVPTGYMTPCPQCEEEQQAREEECRGVLTFHAEVNILGLIQLRSTRLLLLDMMLLVRRGPSLD